MKSKLRGHNIELVNGEWVYSDDKTPTVDGYLTRPCGYCGKPRTAEGHDGCLGTLPDVMNACCGHGEVSEAYVQFWDNTVVSGENAIEIMKRLKEGE